MTISEFPPVDWADEDGLLAFGGDLDPESILLAYRSGIFPWPLDESILAWFAPPRRAVLWLEDFHISRSLRRERNKSRFQFCFNRNFAEVISRCAELKNRGKQSGTWITSGIIKSYSQLRELGVSHSAECYLEDRLVGGLYGVSLGGFFAGESMFYREPNASKLALSFLVEHLQRQGVEWIDCQVMTPHLKAFGAVEIPRKEYMQMLEEALSHPPLSF